MYEPVHDEESANHSLGDAFTGKSKALNSMCGVVTGPDFAVSRSVVQPCDGLGLAVQVRSRLSAIAKPRGKIR